MKLILSFLEGLVICFNYFLLKTFQNLFSLLQHLFITFADYVIVMIGMLHIGVSSYFKLLGCAV